MQWLIVADAGSARFFQLDEETRELTEVIALVHPEARLRAADTLDDGQGRRPRASSTSRDDVEDEQFARLVAAEAKKHNTTYDLLHIAAPPRFLGHLRKVLDKAVTRKLAGTLAKDLTHLKVHELTRVIDR